jgi:hypothetical protein
MIERGKGVSKLQYSIYDMNLSLNQAPSSHHQNTPFQIVFRMLSFQYVVIHFFPTVEATSTFSWVGCNDDALMSSSA